MTDDLFVDAYAISTGLKQRIPRHWLDDPIQNRLFRKTPSQRELDGELPPRPAGDAKGPEIAEFAEAAGIDLSGIKANADKLTVIEDALGPNPVQQGVVEVEPGPPIDDPLAPEKVAHVDPQPDADTASTASTVDTESTDDTPAAGDEEN